MALVNLPDIMMVAISICNAQLVALPAALPLCLHSRMHFGLDRCYCPDCKQGFGPKTPEYQALLVGVEDLLYSNAAEIIAALADCADTVCTIAVAPLQPLPTTAHKNCSGADTKSLPAGGFKGDPKSAPEQNHWVEVYSPSQRKDYKYYRYMWMEGRKLKHKHIGGSIKSHRALALKEAVERAIREGRSPAQIEQLIKAWSKE